MIRRPQGTLVSDPYSCGTSVEKQTKNGEIQAAKEMFGHDAPVNDPQMDTPVSLGTTIMAVAYDGGVVLAADSRTSSGSYVVNRTSNKLTKLTEKIYCCRSGSAADTQNLAELLTKYLEQFSISDGRSIPVKSAAALFQRLCYANKWSISAGIIVAGYDDINGGSVYSIPSGGSCVKLPYALGGSGSIFLYSLMDTMYKSNMTKFECIAFCQNMVSHALSRDGSSGGVVRTIALSKDGAEDCTLPWPKIPYCMERDTQYKKQAVLNEPFSSTAKGQGNVMDSSKN